MSVLVGHRLRSIRINQPSLRRTICAILSAVGESSAELAVTFVGDRRMRRLNRTYRRKDRTTDVLAFAMREASPGRRPGAGGKGRAVNRKAQGARQGASGKREERPWSVPSPRAPRSAPALLGDVVISIPTAARQAGQGDRSLDEELAVLLIHGILHLCGYDHERGEPEARRMHRRERAIRRTLGRLPRLVRRKG